MYKAIHERKSVGTLYHYTTPNRAYAILMQDRIHPSKSAAHSTVIDGKSITPLDVFTVLMQSYEDSEARGEHLNDEGVWIEEVFHIAKYLRLTTPKIDKLWKYYSDEEMATGDICEDLYTAFKALISNKNLPKSSITTEFYDSHFNEISEWLSEIGIEQDR